MAERVGRKINKFYSVHKPMVRKDGPDNKEGKKHPTEDILPLVVSITLRMFLLFRSDLCS